MISVIIASKDEAYLEKTIDGILQNNDANLIGEIVVIDDESIKPVVINKPKVRVIRNDKRRGLIWSRNFATMEAKYDIIISIDAHCKVFPDWARNLTKHVKTNRRIVAVPITNCLNVETWKSTPPDSCKMNWDLSLNFGWVNDDGSDLTPIVAGHCFAFSKQWWAKIGGFDDQMRQWGSENVDFSLKTWFCGGMILVERDSRISHYFKSSGFGYHVDMCEVTRNKVRVIEVWLEKYKHVFYDHIGCNINKIDVGNLSKQIGVRDMHQIYDTDWFLDKFNPGLKTAIDIHQRHKDKTCVIIGAGPSLDDLDWSFIKDYDIVIGLNYVVPYFDCDYAVFHDYDPALHNLKEGKLSPEVLFVPRWLKRGLKTVDAKLINDKWSIYNLGAQDNKKALTDNSGDVFHHASVVFSAIHLAQKMGIKKIILAGCDFNVKSGGQSHSKKIKEYNGGYYWPNDINTQNYIKRIKNGFEMLREAARIWKIELSHIGS